MKKSIAFLGALLFGSVTFGQVTKNDSIKKPASRKVSADDLKKFPVDTETIATDGHIKIESTQKHLKYTPGEKDSYDAAAETSSKIKGSMTQKGRDNKIMLVEEKQSTLSTSKHLKGGMIQKGKSPEGTAATEKQHYTVKLTRPNPANLKTTPTHLKGGAIQKSNATENETIIEKTPLIEKTGGSSSTQTTGSTDVFIKIGDIKGEK